MRVFEPLRRLQPQHVRVLKAVLFVACLIPVMRLGWLAMHHGLGANPIEYITRSTGWWILSFLMLTLLVTPLRRCSSPPATARAVATRS